MTYGTVPFVFDGTNPEGIRNNPGCFHPVCPCADLAHQRELVRVLAEALTKSESHPNIDNVMTILAWAEAQVKKEEPKP